MATSGLSKGGLHTGLANQHRMSGAWNHERNIRRTREA